MEAQARTRNGATGEDKVGTKGEDKGERQVRIEREAGHRTALRFGAPYQVAKVIDGFTKERGQCQVVRTLGLLGGRNARKRRAGQVQQGVLVIAHKVGRCLQRL